MRRIVLLRHGLTPWNAEGRYQGQLDVELHETGHQQAKAAAVALEQAYDISQIFSSDLARTRETAAYLAEETGLEVTHDARLREFHGGESQGLLRSEVLERWGTERPDYGAIGGESHEDVGRRVVAALGDVADAMTSGDVAIVVSHGGAIRQAVASILGWTDEMASTVRGMDNCGWTELTMSDDRWRLVAYNRVAS